MFTIGWICYCLCGILTVLKEDRRLAALRKLSAEDREALGL